MLFDRARRGLGSRWAPSLGLALIVVGLVTTSVAFAEPAAQATPTCAVPPQGIVVTIDSPAAGTALPVDGNVTVTGVAYDTSVMGGTGIDRVSVFLGDRDAGGIFWGDATLGQPSPELGGDRTTAGYSRRSPSIPAGSGTRAIFVYAHTASGREASASIPVFLGAAPTAVRGQVPTAVPAPLPACTPTPTPSPTAITVPTVPPTPTLALLPPTPTPTPAPAVPAPAEPAAPAAPAPAAPAPAAPAPAPAPAAATAPAAQTTAPRGGAIPPSIGLLLLAAGAGVLGTGFALRRRERRGAPPKQ